MDPFEDLPDELIIVQAANLPLSTLDDLCLTSQRFNRVVCDNELFWQQKFIRDYEFVPQNYRGTWKQLYREYSATWGRPGASREIGTVVPVAPQPLVPRARIRTGADSGFGVPALFDQELVEFFAQAELGPVIEGQFKTDPAGNVKRIPDTKTLQPTRRPLNLVLFFTQPFILGERNPLYGIIPSGTLTPLFALHAYYSGMQNPNDPTRLVASEEMRRLLAGTIERTIQRDRDREDRGVFDPKEVFDPNNFLYSGFSKLISAGRIQSLTNEEVEALTEEVTRVYGPLFPGFDLITPQMVLQYQQDQVDLARAYKNERQAQEIRTRRMAQRQARQMTRPSQDLLEFRLQQILQDPNLTQVEKDALVNELYR